LQIQKCMVFNEWYNLIYIYNLKQYIIDVNANYLSCTTFFEKMIKISHLAIDSTESL